MKISVLAQLAGCSTQTIRFYEETGLMPKAQRNVANYRQYSEAHVERLCFIRNCRSLGMNHDEIHALLTLINQSSGECDGVSTLIQTHLKHIESRLSELKQLKTQLQILQKKCTHPTSIDQCGIVHELSAKTPRTSTKMEVCSSKKA